MSAGNVDASPDEFDQSRALLGAAVSFAGWSEAEILEYRANMALTNAMLDGSDCGLSKSTVKRWLDRRAKADAGDPRAMLWGRSTGRPPLAVPTPEDVKKLLSAYIRTNRGKGRGSKTLAARMLALNGELSPETTEAILRPRASKHTLTKTIRDAMHVAPAMVRMHRSPRNAQLSGMYCPGTLRMVRNDSSLRRLQPGERQSWDDGSINFCVCVPWSWGGDKCSDKYGVRVGRFQLLAGIDDATDFCPGFSFVMRPLSSYRKEDSGAAVFRTWRDTYRPDSVMFEGGAWQSHMLKRFLEVSGVELHSAKGRPHLKLIENYWNRLWSVLSTVDGQIGRYRGEMEAENRQWMRCRDAVIDPRTVFLSLDAALDAMEKGIKFINAEPTHSKHWGTWTPEEAHAAGWAERPRSPLDDSLAWLVAPEQHERVTRRGMVAARVDSPFGSTFPYHFAAEELFEVEGARVRVCFDPWDSPIRATLVLAQEWHGRKAGEVLTHRAECLNSAPEIAEHADGTMGTDFDLNALDRAIKLRREVGRAMRTEYRAIFGPRKTLTEIKGADGSLLRTGSHSGDGAALVIPGRPADAVPEWREELAARTARMEENEAELRRRGELLPV